MTGRAPEKSRALRGGLALGWSRCAVRRWRASPLRSPTPGQGGVCQPLDSPDRMLKQRIINRKNKGHWVTPLLAQRIPVSGNSYFWRAAFRGETAALAERQVPF
jgi:hypothetical protein